MMRKNIKNMRNLKRKMALTATNVKKQKAQNGKKLNHIRINIERTEKENQIAKNSIAGIILIRI